MKRKGIGHFENLNVCMIILVYARLKNDKGGKNEWTNQALIY